MKTLFIFNRQPYDGTDVAWNALRLAEQMLNIKSKIRIFLMNDSVDLARDAAIPPDGYFNLGQMLKDLVSKGVEVKVCGTCMARCGLHKNHPYFNGAKTAKMTELAEWVSSSDKIISL